MKEELDDKKVLMNQVSKFKNGIDFEKQFTKSQKKIINAATELFSTHGFEKSSTIDIAKAAGVAEITLFRNFKSKNNLLYQLLAPTIAELSKKSNINNEKYLLPEEIIKVQMTDRINLVQDNKIEMNILLKEFINHEEVREAILEHISEPLKNSIALFLEDKIEKNYFRDINVKAASSIFMYCLLGFTISTYVLKIEPFSDDTNEIVESFMDIILHGLYK
ncbi:putative transcriptional regulator [Bacillus sp. TS-2]|nr:putative transcriptional regulator [Bacillus sp. TS-2]